MIGPLTNNQVVYLCAVSTKELNHFRYTQSLSRTFLSLIKRRLIERVRRSAIEYDLLTTEVGEEVLSQYSTEDMRKAITSRKKYDLYTVLGYIYIIRDISKEGLAEFLTHSDPLLVKEAVRCMV